MPKDTGEEDSSHPALCPVTPRPSRAARCRGPLGSWGRRVAFCDGSGGQGHTTAILQLAGRRRGEDGDGMRSSSADGW